VLITEFLASNDTILYDGDGVSSDWIELYNPTASTIDLVGWHLTDDQTDLTKWEIPDAGEVDLLLAPGEYMVLIASGKGDDPDFTNPAGYYVDSSGYLHTSFKLSANDGDQHESVLLADPTGALVHGYTDYPEQVTDISYGLESTGVTFESLVETGEAAAYLVPTIGDAGLVPDPGVSEGWTAESFDDSGWTDTVALDVASLLVSEVSTGAAKRFVEIENVSDAAIDTTGWLVLVNDAPVAATADINAVNPTAWSLPASPDISAGQVLYRTSDVLDDYWGGEINWDPEGPGWVMIVDETGDVVDFVAWGYSDSDISGMSIDYGAFTGITAGGAWTGVGAENGTADLGPVTGGFVAFNDHIRGGGTHGNATEYAANGATSGLLKDVSDGSNTSVTLTTSHNGVSFATNGASPASGTDAHNAFNTFVDFTGGSGSSLETAGGDDYTHTFSGLNTDAGVTYDFIGTAIRGNSGYTTRWSVYTLESVVSFDAAHSIGDGVVTSAQNASLASNQVALWSGYNSGSGQGWVAHWTNIDPGADGMFSVKSEHYTGWIPAAVHSGQVADGSKGYGIAGLRLEELPPQGPLSWLVRTGNRDNDNAGDFVRSRQDSMGLENAELVTPFPTTSTALTGVGFSDNQPAFEANISTDVYDDMNAQNASVWARIEFQPTTPDPSSTFDQLILKMKYDDGFVAYLNGVEVAARNAPGRNEELGDIDWNSTATASHADAQAVVFEDIDISDYISQLHSGVNVLAIHGLNILDTDADFLLLPELIASSTLGAPHYMLSPTPEYANLPGSLGFVADTRFSVDRGFYDTPQQVAITTASSGATIMYTLDGTKPTTSNGTEYTIPIDLAATTTLRAYAYKAGYEPTNVDTHTYIFVKDVVSQDYQATLDAGFPTSWNGTSVDYGMDSDVIGTFDADGNPTGGDNYGGQYASTIQDDLLDIPTLSIVMDIDDMFGSNGIYSHPGSRGISWERETSVELMYPDGTEGFQVDAGIRIQGGHFRGSGYKKHSLRLLFKDIYGPSKLNYNWFGDGADDSFDTITLRAGANDGYVWSSARYTEQYTRDQFGRDLQRAAGGVASHGDFVHLYINGIYWGLYNPAERPDDSFSASYFGGDKETWDSRKVGETVAGNSTAWNTMLSMSAAAGSSNDAFLELQGLNPDGTRNDAYPDYLDVENYINYLAVNVWGGNWDWPWKNWWAGRDRSADSTGFKFYSWDYENTMGNNLGRSPLDKNALNNNFTGSSNAGQAHTSLKSNAEYRMQFADEVHRLFFNGGVLTPSSLIDRYSQLADKVERAMVGESARWGDTSSSTPLTLYDWYDADQSHAGRDWILHTYLPARTDIVKQQLIAANLYSSVTAPAFNQHGGSVASGFQLSITTPPGTIYYTLDGSDPRMFGGAISGDALTYGGAPITLTESVTVKARAYNGGVWSALNEADFLVDSQPIIAGPIIITEINYSPYDPTAAELAVNPAFIAGDFEFIEIKNISAETVDLLGMHFTKGITYNQTTSASLAAGAIAVIVRNASAFAERYGGSATVLGTFTGILDSSGERLQMLGLFDEVIFDFEYNDGGSWPGRAAGKGASLILEDPTVVPQYGLQHAEYLEDSGNWRSSPEYGGSPGADGVTPFTDIVINEVLTHTDAPLVDTIELHNTTDQTVNIGNWFLSDSWGWASSFSNGNYSKFQIPSGTMIGPYGYLAFDEDDFNTSAGVDPLDFALDGAMGEDVWLMEADGTGKLIRFVDHVEFTSAANGESFGRWPDGSGSLYPMETRTLGADNTPSGPRGPMDIIVSEIAYNIPDPDGVGGVDPDDLEFIELFNATNQAITLAEMLTNPHDATQYLADWRLRGGVDMEFDIGSSIGAYSTLVVLSFNPDKPENASRVAGFRNYYGIDASVPLAGGYSGKLDNGGERFRLKRPDSPPQDASDFVPHYIEDQVDYDDLAPWPTSPDGTGDSLNRLQLSSWGDDPGMWIGDTPTPGSAVLAPPNDPPFVVNPITDVTVDEDASDTVVDLSTTFDDPDLGDTLSLSISGDTDPGLVTTNFVGTTLMLSYVADQNGSTDITIRATDTLGAWTEDTFTVTVNPTADPPTLNNPVADFSVDEDASDTVIDLAAVFDDPDLPGDTLVYSITSNTNISLVTTDIVGSDLTLSYAADQNGSSEITVRTTDQNGAGSWVEDTFTVTVDPVNDAPTLASPLAEVTVDEDAADTVIDLSSVFDDIDLGDALTFQVTVNTNISLVATDVTGSDLTLSYLADQSGSADITVRATDSGAPGLFVEDTFSVTVDPVNDAPTVIAPISDVNAFENDPGEILNLAGVFYDAEDGANVTLSLEGNTNSALVTANLVGSDLTVSYAADQSGSSDITIRATDTAAPGLWVEETFTVTVNPDNFAPTVVSQIADLTVNTGDPDTVMYLSDVFDDSVGLKPTLDYTVIEIDPVTGAQTAGSGLFLYTFTLYGNDGVESVFATTTLTFTGAIQQTKAFGTADVNDELNAAIFEGIAGSGYLAALDTWIFAGWQEIAPDDTSLTGAPVVLSVGSGTIEYFEQKDLVQIVAAGDVQWTGMHARLGADYPTSGTADANRLVYSVSNNTNPGLVAANVVGAQLTLDYSPGGSGVADITIRATDPHGAWAEDTFTVTVESSSEVVGRHVFYNNSSWDAGGDDNQAVAPDKTPLLPGGSVTASNYTSYSRGINGIMVDIDGMTGTPKAGDFIIRVNASDDPDTWSAGPAPTVSVHPGEGFGGSDRVKLIWPDGAIANQWVEVTVRATGKTGLGAADLFYYGNAVGETSGDGVIGQAEYDTFKSQFGQRGGIGTLASDFDGDGRVGLRDFALMRSRFGDEVQSPTVPAPAPPAASPLASAEPESDDVAPASDALMDAEKAVISPVNTPAAPLPFVSVGKVALPVADEHPVSTPSVERELTGVLQGDNAAGDDLLIDILAESALDRALAGPFQ
jgi:hypothetical protein